MSNKVTCMVVDDEPMAREIISSFVGKIHNLELVATCKNVSEAFSILQKESRRRKKCDFFYIFTFNFEQIHYEIL